MQTEQHHDIHYQGRCGIAGRRTEPSGSCCLGAGRAFRSIPCDTLDGVRRRVRPSGGRCQGAFCGPLVLQIIAHEAQKPLEQVGKSGPGGEVLFGSIKEVQP